ncbi:MAG: protein BatD, partial [Promethearchaeota archaeon]
PPESKGFWKEDMGKEKQHREVIKGRRYEVLELKYALFPVTVGNMTIGEAKLNCVVSKPVRDVFSFGFSRGVKRELRTKPISIKVRSLPPVPGNFSGAVGSFTMSAELDRDTVKQNEPLTLITTIVGDGNVRNIELPEVRIPGFKIYGSGSDVNMYESQGKMKGKKIFKTLVVPNRSGGFEIPRISFAYFNPEKKEYITLKTEPIPFTVVPGEGGTDVTTAYGSGGVEVIGQDINFIKRDVKLRDQGSLMGSIKYFLLVNFILVSVFLWITVSLNIKEKAKSKEHILRRRGAYRNSLKLIAIAKKENRRGKTKEGYEVLHRAIIQFFADKCNLSIWGTTEEEIVSYLRQKGVGKETENQIAKLLDICNRARYSKQSPDGEKLSESIQLAKTLLKKLHSL